MGGEHLGNQYINVGTLGSSPHGRGTPVDRKEGPGVFRFIPAWAGNTSSCSTSLMSNSVHPRMGGEHPFWPGPKFDTSGSSPHGRGTQNLVCRPGLAGRFIPAWAGNTHDVLQRRELREVHPRMGGEHPHMKRPAFNANGSSPHGRGTRRPPSNRKPVHRFIPAWAGNTRPPRYRPAPRSVHPRMGGEHCVRQ